MYNHFSSVTKSLEKKKIIIHRFNHSNPEVRMQKEKKTNKTAVRARGGSLSFTQCGKEFARLALRAHRSSKDQFDEVVNNFFLSEMEQKYYNYDGNLLTERKNKPLRLGLRVLIN